MRIVSIAGELGSAEVAKLEPSNKMVYVFTRNGGHSFAFPHCLLDKALNSGDEWRQFINPSNAIAIEGGCALLMMSDHVAMIQIDDLADVQADVRKFAFEFHPTAVQVMVEWANIATNSSARVFDNHAVYAALCFVQMFLAPFQSLTYPIWQEENNRTGVLNHRRFRIIKEQLLRMEHLLSQLANDEAWNELEERKKIISLRLMIVQLCAATTYLYTHSLRIAFE
jgi:hypothetical protein